MLPGFEGSGRALDFSPYRCFSTRISLSADGFDLTTIFVTIFFSG